MSRHECCEDLYAIGKNLSVGDYFGPDLEDVFQTAQDVAEILTLDFSESNRLCSLRKNTMDYAEFELANHNLWFQLGIIFAKANRFIARTSNREDIPAKFGDMSKDVSQPFPFLQYAMMCFSGGKGFKHFKRQPSPTEWRRCSNGNDQEHGEACIQLGSRPYGDAKKVPEIGCSTDEIVNRAKPRKEKKRAKTTKVRPIRYCVHRDPEG